MDVRSEVVIEVDALRGTFDINDSQAQVKSEILIEILCSRLEIHTFIKTTVGFKQKAYAFFEVSAEIEKSKSWRATKEFHQLRVCTKKKPKAQGQKSPARLYHRNPSKVTSYSTEKSPGKRLSSSRSLEKGQHTKSKKSIRSPEPSGKAKKRAQ
jgi:hypothetical protein